MTNQLLYAPQMAFAGGVYAPGAKATFYQTGTTTPLTVYTDSALTTPHDSPVVADAEGVFPPAFWNRAVEAKVVITESDDTAIETIDPVPATSATGSAASGVSFSPVTGNTATDVQEAIENIQTNINTYDDAATKGVTGSDADAVTGTAGTADNLVKWNGDGDAVDSGVSSSGVPRRLSSTTLSDDATAEFTMGSATLHEFRFFNVIPATDAVDPYIRLSNDGGSTFRSGAADYKYAALFVNTASVNGGGAAGAAFIGMTDRTIGSDAGEYGISCRVFVFKPNDSASETYLSWTGTLITGGGGVIGIAGGGLVDTAEDNDAIQFYFSSGNLESGTIEHWEHG